MHPHACGSGGEHSGGGEHSSGGSRPSTRPPTKQHKRLADARAAGANGQPARGRHAPRCAPADVRSAGRGSGLAALPRPSQCRPEKGPVYFFKIGTRWAPRRRGPAHALWCCAQGSGADACDERLVSAARGVQRAQQGGARALFPILSPILFPIFGKANSRDFPPKKILTI
jgi:hypothetical protein